MNSKTQSSSSKGQSRGGSSSKEMCDYCHQQPKFPPYEYCSKACGSRAKAANRGAVARDPNMCKQCGQRPVYKGHQFCGKNCANTWQSLHGPFYSGYSSGYSSWYGSTSQFYWGPQRTYSPAPARQSHHHLHNHGHYGHSGHHGHQGDGQGGVVNGVLNAIKTIISPGPTRPPPLSPKRRSTLPTPPNNPPYSASSSRDPATGSLSTSMPTGVGGKTSPRPSAPTSPAPGQQRATRIVSTGSGTQDQDENDQDSEDFDYPPSPSSPPPEQDQDSLSGQYSPTAGMPEVPPVYSPFDELPDDDNFLDVDDPGQDQVEAPEDDDDGGPAPAPPPTQGLPPTPKPQNKPQGSGPSSGQFPHPADVGRGKKKDMKGLRNNPMPRYITTASGLHKVCRLEGCREPVFVDKLTKLPSEYCCLGHREDAVKSGQVEGCIMCKKNPRSQIDRFCSKACRDESMTS